MTEPSRPDAERAPGDERAVVGSEPAAPASPLKAILWIALPLALVLVYGIVTSLR